MSNAIHPLLGSIFPRLLCLATRTQQNYWDNGKHLVRLFGNSTPFQFPLLLHKSIDPTEGNGQGVAEDDESNYTCINHADTAGYSLLRPWSLVSMSGSGHGGSWSRWRWVRRNRPRQRPNISPRRLSLPFCTRAIFGGWPLPMILVWTTPTRLQLRPYCD